MFKVVTQFSRPPGTAEATFRMALVAGRAAMLRHWHLTYVPGHFETSANKKYGYQPRQGDNEPPRIARFVSAGGGRVRQATRSNPHYSWRKRRQMRHNRPLVWSGDSAAIATSPANFEVRDAGPHRSKGVFVGLPQYFYKYRKDAYRVAADGTHSATRSQPNKADELLRTTPAERADMARVGQARVTQFVRDYRTPATAVA